MPDTPVFCFCVLEEAGKRRQKRHTQLNLVLKCGIRERIFWDIGSTQKRKAKKKKYLNQILVKGKVTRYAKAETKREETLFLYVPCLCRALCSRHLWDCENSLQRVTSGTTWNIGIITSLQAIVKHKSLTNHLNQ